jgi:Skp family chaperone for outer membrane proteins
MPVQRLNITISHPAQQRSASAVNKFLLSTTAVAVATILAGIAVAQQTTKPPAGAAASPELPHRVALIDMAHVFKNYKKFEVLREDLKLEVGQGEETAKAKAEEIKTLQAKMKTFTETSPEFTKAEEALAKKSAEFEAFRRAAQRDFLKKESQIYHTVYMDVHDLVEKYAKHYKYTLVMRFSREELDTENAQKLIEGMNRQVVYYREDDDITDEVTDVLNRSFNSAAAAPATTPGTGAARPATSGAPRTASPAANGARPGTTNK